MPSLNLVGWVMSNDLFPTTKNARAAKLHGEVIREPSTVNALLTRPSGVCEHMKNLDMAWDRPAASCPVAYHGTNHTDGNRTQKRCHGKNDYTRVFLGRAVAGSPRDGAWGL